MSKGTRDTLFLQGMILACAGILTKIIGFIYRIPMANFLGDQGNGIYSVAFGIYNIALTLSSYSLPLAVSKLVSHRTAKNEHRNARRVFRDSLLFAVLVGAAACAALYLGADALEELYHRPGLARPLRVLAPTTFVVAVLGVFRGFFQGHGNMVPTALSQIAEQIVNAVVSVIATYQFMMIYASSADVYSYGAAGGTLGTLAGAAAALLLFFWMFWLMRGTLRRRAARDHSRRERDSAIAGELVLTVIPIILSQTIYQIGYTIDDFLFGNIMAEKGFSDAVISSLQGVFNTQYNQLINLPVAVATAMAASTLPAIIRAGVQGGAGDASDRRIGGGGILRSFYDHHIDSAGAELHASAGISFRSVADHSRDFGLGSAEIYRSGRIWSGHRKCVFSGDRESFEHESYGEEAALPVEMEDSFRDSTDSVPRNGSGDGDILPSGPYDSARELAGSSGEHRGIGAGVRYVDPAPEMLYAG